MAQRGSIKARSVEHETAVAQRYGGRRSPSSGAADHDDGDVRIDGYLVECKMTGTFEKPAKSVSIKLNDLEKITDEARAIGREPMMALRIYNPESVLADDKGNIDLVVRLWEDDWLLYDKDYHRG